jgi:hypothetical protein
VFIFFPTGSGFCQIQFGCADVIICKKIDSVKTLQQFKKLIPHKTLPPNREIEFCQQNIRSYLLSQQNLLS